MLEVSFAYWLLFSFVMCAVLLELARVASISRWLIIPNFAIAITICFFVEAFAQRQLVTVYALLLIHLLNPNGKWIALLTINCILLLLIKFSYGVLSLALALPYLSFLFLFSQKKNQALMGFAVLISSYLIGWFLLYHSLDGAINYIRGGLAFSQGSTTAMALNPTNNYVACISVFLCFLLSIVLFAYQQSKHYWIIGLCFLCALFIWLKYAFGREDTAHLGYLMRYAVHLFPLLAIATKCLWRKAAILVLLPLCFYHWQAMQTPEMGPPDYQLSAQTGSSFYRPSIQDIGNLAKVFNQISTKKLASLQLPQTLRSKIGNDTVDIYPWETLIAAANQLNWKPRPVYQSYITYTPFLDRANQAFFASNSAPKFLIWHYHSFADIDARYPLSSDPLTLQAILQHYRLLSCEGSFCLWQRSEKNLLNTVTTTSVTTSLWNSWIPLPLSNKSVDIWRLHVSSTRTWLGKLNLLLWKEGGISIDYRLHNGDIQTKDVVLDNAPSGLWISPYLDSLNPSIRPETITTEQLQQWQEPATAEGYVEKAEATADGRIHIVGWGLIPFANTSTQRITLFIYNAQHAYKILAPNRPRPGISDYFGHKDLDNCGFDINFLSGDIAPGTYQVSFGIENNGSHAFSKQVPVSLEIPSKITTHNVEAIRLRTTRPWAFTDTVDTYWSGLQFTEQQPW
ncbi:MAG TPA: hypothetical protein PK244_00090 [Pseudomonadales bacterium]|nr:hypothetical protein [Pseudomonadales bacterium]HRG49926.1 hypothetical protein [Pseudomonadales bacterium]